jgi:hypothetical protein
LGTQEEAITAMQREVEKVLSKESTVTLLLF